MKIKLVGLPFQGEGFVDYDSQYFVAIFKAPNQNYEWIEEGRDFSKKGFVWQRID